MTNHAQYKIEYDSLHKRYNVLRFRSVGSYGWMWVASFRFKWAAVRRAKRCIKYDEREKNRTREVVWGPFP